MGNRIISHPLRHMGLSRDQRCSKGSETIKWVEPPLSEGGRCLSFLSFFFLQSSIHFSQGSVIERQKVKKLPQVLTVTKKLHFFFSYIWTGEKPTGNRWAGQKVVLCLSMFVQINCCVCVWGGGWQPFPLSYGCVGKDALAGPWAGFQM